MERRARSKGSHTTSLPTPSSLCLPSSSPRERRKPPMRKLIASEFVTLDGVMEAPGHEPTASGKNAWALQYASKEQQRFKIDETYEVEAMLLGRVTYDIFAAFWPTAPNDEGFADRMNEMPKYVVSKHLKTAAWQNTTVINDPAEEIPELKDQPGGSIIIYGS